MKSHIEYQNWADVEWVGLQIDSTCHKNKVYYCNIYYQVCATLWSPLRFINCSGFMNMGKLHTPNHFISS